jgi:hypothetical protein
MDFKNESYWYDIWPETNNKYQIRTSLKFNLAEQKAEGVYDLITFGYPAVALNKQQKEASKEEYVDQMEKEVGGNFEITGYEHYSDRSDDRKVADRFNFEISDMLQGDMIYFNPFFISFFDQNPFQMEERLYPIDFGYPSQYKYIASIQIP